MLLKDIRDYIATLNIAEDEHCYSGKMPCKKPKSIGIYNLKTNGATVIPVGGVSNASYATKGISLLVHWTESQIDTELTAILLFNRLQATKMETINGHTIKFIKILSDEPVTMGTDDGTYEYIIECLFFMKGMNNNGRYNKNWS